MKGTEDYAKKCGFTDEQAAFIGRLDDMFEEAQKLGLVTGDQAEAIGRYTGIMMAKTTGREWL